MAALTQLIPEQPLWHARAAKGCQSSQGSSGLASKGRGQMKNRDLVDGSSLSHQWVRSGGHCDGFLVRTLVEVKSVMATVASTVPRSLTPEHSGQTLAVCLTHQDKL